MYLDLRLLNLILYDARDIWKKCECGLRIESEYDLEGLLLEER